MRTYRTDVLTQREHRAQLLGEVPCPIPKGPLATAAWAQSDDLERSPPNITSEYEFAGDRNHCQECLDLIFQLVATNVNDTGHTRSQTLRSIGLVFE